MSSRQGRHKKGNKVVGFVADEEMRAALLEMAAADDPNEKNVSRFLRKEVRKLIAAFNRTKATEVEATLVVEASSVDLPLRPAKGKKEPGETPAKTRPAEPR